MEPLHHGGERIDPEEVEAGLIEIQEYGATHGGQRGGSGRSLDGQGCRGHRRQPEQTIALRHGQEALSSRIAAPVGYGVEDEVRRDTGQQRHPRSLLQGGR